MAKKDIKFAVSGKDIAQHPGSPIILFQEARGDKRQHCKSLLKSKGRFFCNQIKHNIFYISILTLLFNIENFKEKAPTKSPLYELIHKRLHHIWLQKNRPFAIKLS